MLRFDIITIFPEFFRGVFDFGIVRRARAAGLVEIAAHDLRGWTHDRHKVVDDRPFGGGDGMVLKAGPIFEAVETLAGASDARALRAAGRRVVLLSPQGRPLTQSLAAELAKAGQVVVVCGRYEGVDERVLVSQVDEEWSIGDYVLSGGEIAAMVLIDAMVRLLPGVLGHADSAREESFQTGLLDHPHYTRPEVIDGRAVPAVLLTGDHGAIRRWRLKAALGRSWIRRPDLLAERSFGPDEATLLEEYLREHQLIPSPWQGEGEGGG